MLSSHLFDHHNYFHLGRHDHHQDHDHHIEHHHADEKGAEAVSSPDYWPHTAPELSLVMLARPCGWLEKM